MSHRRGFMGNCPASKTCQTASCPRRWLVAKRSYAMINKISHIWEAKGTLGRCPTVKIFLSFALGFIAINQPAILKAQDPLRGSTSAPSTAALATPATAPSPAPVSDEYLINPGDVLDVYFYDVPELSHTYTVGPSGAMIVPLLPKPVQAT